MDAQKLPDIQLGEDGHLFPSLRDRGAWEVARFPKPMSDVLWTRTTRAPVNGGGYGHMDVLKQTRHPLSLTRGLESDCLQVLDELHRIAMRKEWELFSIDAARVSYDPDGPPPYTAYAVSPTITMSAGSIGKRIRRNRHRVGVCINALEGLLVIDRARDRKGKWRVSIRIAVPLDIIARNEEAHRKRSAEKEARRAEAKRAPAIGAAGLHAKFATLERIDHGVAADDRIAPAKRFAVQAIDGQAVHRARGGARKVDEFPASTRRGTYSQQEPNLPVGMAAEFEGKLRASCKRIGLHHSFAENAIKHDPHLLARIIDNMAKQSRVRDPARYVRGEWNRIQQRQVEEGRLLDGYDSDADGEPIRETEAVV